MRGEECFLLQLQHYHNIGLSLYRTWIKKKISTTQNFMDGCDLGVKHDFFFFFWNKIKLYIFVRVKM